MHVNSVVPARAEVDELSPRAPPERLAEAVYARNPARMVAILVAESGNRLATAKGG
jgi:hypothetical protein